MNVSCDCPCLLNTTKAIAKQLPPADGSWSFILFAVVFFAIIFIPLSFLSHYTVEEAKKRFEAITKTIGITDVPITPEWLKTQKKTVFYGKKGVRFECRDYEVQFSENSEVEKEQSALKWLEKEVYSLFTEYFYAGRMDEYKSLNLWEEKTPSIPKTTCLASVPMENFKCGETPNDFSPISGSAPGSFLTYQMFGDNRIQVTYYVEDGKTYPAGYCVYIEDPYADEADYSDSIICDLRFGLKYEVDPKIKEEYQERVLRERRAEIQGILNELSLNVCKSSMKPVMIGRVDGSVKHFEWDQNMEMFSRIHCESCNLEYGQDAPRLISC